MFHFILKTAASISAEKFHFLQHQRSGTVSQSRCHPHTTGGQETERYQMAGGVWPDSPGK